MTKHEQIYLKEADAYERMVGRQPDLSACVNEIRPYAGLDVLDLGAGSGRLSAFLAKEARSLICTDISPAMLALLEHKLQEQGADRNWSTIVADHRQLPIADGSVDLAVSGWSISYLANSGQASWEENLALIISELSRVLRPDGTIVILETLGTGTEVPDPPEFLRGYYQALEDRYGFKRKWIRTDYQFDSVEEAQEHTGFFFGDRIVKKIADHQWSTVPECAGIWWKHML